MVELGKYEMMEDIFLSRFIFYSHSIITSLKQRKTDPKSSIAIAQRLQDIPLEVSFIMCPLRVTALF